ncbi:hypothetical protein NKR19_g4379 [Coniochaeta hoffmannii]|uniref:Uncharacterized protein n=1 Tax=Coniochaeta hoffmannii TaxID=91930 RepID=A0AA38VVZ2_9PEZI|nr:hypothetical protein NKR19_g4379 [Coniochaeta hoffmannii]
MHLIRTILTLALATLAVSAPPSLSRRQDGDTPDECPEECDCSQYTDFEEQVTPTAQEPERGRKREA